LSTSIIDVFGRSPWALQEIIDELNSKYIPATLIRYNSEFGIRYFGRPTLEPIPIEPRLLTTFRTRLGLLLEYGIGVTIDSMFKDEFGSDLRWTFVVHNVFGDFYVRDALGRILLRVDCKLLHDESDEYYARFELPLRDVNRDTDVLLCGAWQWRNALLNGVELTYPYLIEAIAVSAFDIGEERDRHLLIRGGHIDETGRPLVPPAGTPLNGPEPMRVVVGFVASTAP